MDDLMPAQGFLAALKRVVDYLYDEQIIDFLNSTPEERKGHIFESLVVLHCVVLLAEVLEEKQFTKFDS